MSRFFHYFDEDVADVDEGITAISITIFDVIVLGIDFDDEDVCLILCNHVFGFTYRN